MEQFRYTNSKLHFKITSTVTKSSATKRKNKRHSFEVISKSD